MKITNNKIDSYIKNIDKEKVAGALVFGPSSSVAQSRFNFITKKIVDNLQDQFLVVDISKERLAAEKSAISDEFYSISMFGGRKLVIIREPQIQATSAMKDFLANLQEIKSNENFILILAGDLDRSNALRKLCENDPKFATLPCYEDSDFVIKKLIEQRLKKSEIDFDHNVVRYLFDILPNNRQIIALEIDKIATYLGGKKANIEDLAKIIEDQSEAAFEKFLNYFIIDDKKNSIIELEKLLKNDFEPVMAVRFLTNYLVKLYNAKAEIELGASFFEAVKNQRLFFKAQSDFERHLKKSSLPQIVTWIKNLQEIEIKMKGSMSSVSALILINYVCGG